MLYMFAVLVALVSFSCFVSLSCFCCAIVCLVPAFNVTQRLTIWIPPLHVLKVAGDRREELRWERELEWRKKGTSPGGSRAASPSIERRPFPDDSRHMKPPPGKLVSVGCFPISRFSKEIQTVGFFEGETNGKDEEEDPLLQKGSRARRKSRIGRQHSYDEEIKNAGSTQAPSMEPGLGLPVSLPRRASAYDVYAVRQGEGLDARAMAAAVAAVSGQGGVAVPPVGGRRSSFRIAAKQEDPPCKSHRQFFFLFEQFAFLPTRCLQHMKYLLPLPRKVLPCLR